MNKGLAEHLLTEEMSPDASDRKSQDSLIYNQIFDAILSQQLQPGIKLAEEELASIFLVSRTVVRRALLRLSQDGIVDLKHNKGASVACPTVKQAKEIIKARRIIESEIIREVVKSIDKGQLQDLRNTVAKEQQFVEKDIRGSGIRMSGDFHLKLARYSNNTTLSKFLYELIPQTSLVIARYEKPGFSNCSHMEHFELIDIIADGDADVAASLMDAHLQKIEDKLDLTEHNRPVDLKDIFTPIG